MRKLFVYALLDGSVPSEPRWLDPFFAPSDSEAVHSLIVSAFSNEFLKHQFLSENLTLYCFGEVHIPFPEGDLVLDERFDLINHAKCEEVTSLLPSFKKFFSDK